MTDLRTLVTFKSEAFNTTEEKPEFINPGNFGDDVARWLAEELRKAGGEAGEVGQEDFGWYFSFRAPGAAGEAGAPHCFVIGYREEEAGAEGTEWLGWLEREAGFLGSLFGARSRGIQPEAAAALDRVLKGADRVRDVRWHRREDFDRGIEEGTPAPA